MLDQKIIADVERVTRLLERFDEHDYDQEVQANIIREGQQFSKNPNVHPRIREHIQKLVVEAQAKFDQVRRQEKV